MIEETLAKIEAAIREARGADPKNKAEIIALLEKLKAEVRREKRSRENLDSVGANLKVAAMEFDVSHPKLGAVVEELILMLAKVGI